MTLSDLHNIKEFGALFDDPRFKGLIAYLRANPSPKRNTGISDATAIIRSEGAWHGWFECISEALAAAHPPVRPSSPNRGAFYASSNSNNQ